MLFWRKNKDPKPLTVKEIIKRLDREDVIITHDLITNDDLQHVEVTHNDLYIFVKRWDDVRYDPPFNGRILHCYYSYATYKKKPLIIKGSSSKLFHSLLNLKNKLENGKGLCLVQEFRKEYPLDV